MAEAVRERVSECTGCPPQVVACVHIDGQPVGVVTQGGFHFGDAVENCMSDRVVCVAKDYDGFGVYDLSENWERCPDCGTRTVSAFQNRVLLSDIGAAHRELARRAELLRLGGGDA